MGDGHTDLSRATQIGCGSRQQTRGRPPPPPPPPPPHRLARPQPSPCKGDNRTYGFVEGHTESVRVVSHDDRVSAGPHLQGDDRAAALVRNQGVASDGERVRRGALHSLPREEVVPLVPRQVHALQGENGKSTKTVEACQYCGRGCPWRIVYSVKAAVPPSCVQNHKARKS